MTAAGTGTIFFASLVDTIRNWAASKSGTFQSLVFWGAFFVLALFVFGWAVMFRKQDRAHRHHHRHHRPEPLEKKTDEENKGGFFSRHRRKRQRKKHRQANPTLA